MGTVERVGVEDLYRLYFRATCADGAGEVTVCAAEATHAQFGRWARSRARVAGPNGPWAPEERARFVAWLLARGVVVYLAEADSQDVRGATAHAAGAA